MRTNQNKIENNETNAKRLFILREIMIIFIIFKRE